MIRAVKHEDADDLAEIYNYYILNSVVTFEEMPIDAAEMKKRILSISRKWPWLVYEQDKCVMGYAYASEWNSRSAYQHAAESTVYLKNEVTKKGMGTLLYRELVQQLTEMNFHAIMAGISLPNEVSVALHEKFGFEKVAHFKEVGHKFGKWIDVGYWELILRQK